MFESLESRCLMASDPMATATSVAIQMQQHGSTLRITTMSADNTIAIYKSGQHVRIDIASAAFNNEGEPIRARQQNLYDCAKIQTIEISSGAGNDRVDVSPKVKANVIVDAGEGSDTISTGSGDDSLYGGAGLDYLVGNAGDDFIDGGEGNDRITATGGDDDVWGNVGDDRITVATVGHRINGGPGRDAATLRAIPASTARLERFTTNAFDYVPYAPTSASLAGIRTTSSGSAELSVSVGNGIQYAYNVDKHILNGFVDVNLLPYRLANANELGFTADLKYQAISLGKLPTGAYVFALNVGGKRVDQATYQVA